VDKHQNQEALLMNDLIVFLKNQKRKIVLIALVTTVQVFGILMVPYFVAEMINVGILEKNIQAILIIGLEMLTAAAGTTLISLWCSYLCADLAALAGKHMRERLFKKTQLLSIRQFNQFGTASMITRATGDITVIQQTMIMITQMILPTPLIALAAVVMTAMISLELVSIPLIAMVVFLLMILMLFKKAGPISETVQPHVDQVNRVVRESIVGIRVIRAFDNTTYEQQRSNDAFVAYASNIIRLNKTFAVFNPFVWAIVGIAMVAVVWFGGMLVLDQTIEIGSIAAVTEYTIIMLMFLMMSAMVLVMLPRMRVCLQRIQEVLDTVPEIKDKTDTSEKISMPESEILEFKQVSFSYPGAEEPVLRDINFTCCLGKTTAIIGGTGSGKSTLAALMLRFYDVREGAIFMAGRDIRTISQHDLREQISYVPQKALLFSGTIAKNLRMGNQAATLNELQHAAKIAQAHGFISQLENGYESPVAQGGANFSGGQKQRLCIARGLVKKVSLYIFDDSFSALDYRTDGVLRQALKEEVQDAAVVIIAQRISTIMDADQIIVLDAGTIAGKGTHRELLETCEVYREIVDSQVSGKE
jgi:ATP-binding cassette subfamily B protein